VAKRRDSAGEDERLLDGLAATTAVALESHERLAELAHQRAILGTVVDASPDALLALGTDNRVVLDNPAARALVRSNRSLAGRLLHEIIDDAARRGGHWDFDFDPDRLLARSRAGTTTRGAFRLSFDGSTTAFESVMAPLPLPRGEMGSLVSMRDVSERTELEEIRRLHQQVTLLASEAAGRAAVLEQVLAASEMGLVFFDADGRVAYANDLFGELLGVRTPAVGLLEGELARLVGEEVDDTFVDLRTPTLLRTHGPGRKALAMRSVEVLDRSERSIGRLVSIRDETAQRELEEARESFIGIAAHELKNPLAVLRIQAELGLRDETRAQPALHRILERTRELQGLVDLLLDATRAELGKLSLERSRVEVGGLVAEAAEPYLAQGAPIAIDAERDVHAWADALRLKQVVSNLLSNAVRYGGEGSISVRVSRAPGEVRIAVRDQGPGIPAEEQARIFDRFGQGRSAARGPGLGIGLYLSQRIAAAHGGRIDLRSAPGAGSTFTVVLPAHAPPDYGADAGMQPLA
jgi:signal transduction histidine kinase